jgi:protein-disulfide isomerase
MSKEAKILTAILVAVIGGMIGLFLIANKSDTPAPVGDKTKLTRETSHKTGSGAITMVEFGDYQCPACSSTHTSIKQLIKDYEGKITFYFRNFPLTNLHKNAQASSQAAEAAGAQGKFWEMHDKLYEAQDEWSNLSDPTDKFVSYATGFGLDIEKFKKALADKQFQTIIDQDSADADALSVQGTPTFFFNGTQYTGKATYADLRDHVEKLLKQ